jgi:hypothetical protein
VVDLKVTLGKVFKIDSALCAIPFYQMSLQISGERSSTSQPAEPNMGGIAEPIGADLPTVPSGHPEGLQGYALLAHVARGENVVDHGTSALSRDRPALLDEVGR